MSSPTVSGQPTGERMNRVWQFVLFGAVSLGAAAACGHAAEVPYLTGRVNDHAGILSLATAQELESLLKAHEDSTSNQVAVLTVESLEGDVLEEFSIRVVDTWKLGKKGKDNGVLLLIAKKERAIRIEVGTGLEGALTDLTCGSIIRHEITPRFKSGDFDGGVRAGVQAILAAIRGEYTADRESATSTPDLLGTVIAGGLFLVVVGLFTLVAFFSSGCASWFLYVFLLPFWFAFPQAFAGHTAGLIMFAAYAALFPIMKVALGRSSWGKGLQKRMIHSGFLSSSGGLGSWSSRGSSSSSSFSGGGGGFSGGGASGSW